MVYGIKTVVKYVLGIDVAGRNFAFYPDRAFVVSYPQTGNTWTRFLIANLVHADQDFSFTNIEKLIPDTSSQSNRALKATRRPRIIKTHEYFDHRCSKIIYIVRDPRDVAIDRRSADHMHALEKLEEDKWIATRNRRKDIPFIRIAKSVGGRTALPASCVRQRGRLGRSDEQARIRHRNCSSARASALKSRPHANPE